MADDPKPDWAKFPNLDDVVTKADIDTKGSGKWSADYVNHMKTAQLLRAHAPGWQFELRTTTDDQSRETHVFRAPDGSGYVVGFFRAPTGSGFLDTPDMAQAIMDNTNKSVQWSKISARDVTDTERRCMCTAAARHFGLAWQLWAKVDLEDPYRQDEPQTQPVKAKAKPSGNTHPKAQQPAKPVEDPINTLRELCREGLNGLYKQHKTQVITDFHAAVKGRWDGVISAAKPTPDNLTTEEQLVWCQEWITNYMPQVAQ